MMADTSLAFDILARDRGATSTFMRVAHAADQVTDSTNRISRSSGDMSRHMTENASGMSRIMSNAASLVLSHWSTAALGIGAGIAALPIIAQAAGGAMVLGLGGGLAAVGVMAAAQSKRVRAEFSGLAKHVKATMAQISRPFETTLIKISGFARRTFDRFVPDLKGAFASMAPTLTTFGDQFFAGLERLRPAIQPLTTAFNGLLKSLGPQMPTIFGNIARSITMISNAVAANPDAFTGLVVGMSRLVVIAAQLTVKLIAVYQWLNRHPGVVRTVAAVLGLLGGPITATITLYTLVRAAIQRAGGMLQSFGRWAMSVGRSVMSALGQLAALPGRFAAWFGGAARAAVQKLGELVARARGIPGRIRSAVGNLGSLLYTAGRNVVQGLINGIRSMLGAIGSAASSVASTIRSYLPFSPAETGPLSGSGSPDLAGTKIGAMVAAGMVRARGMVASAAGLLAGTASVGGSATFGAGARPAGTGAGAGLGAGATVRVIFDTDGLDDEMKRLIRKLVRIEGGGNVQVAFGSGRA